MAKEKQKPYEFLSNLVLALMGTDRIFSNSFFSKSPCVLNFSQQNLWLLFKPQLTDVSKIS